MESDHPSVSWVWFKALPGWESFIITFPGLKFCGKYQVNLAGSGCQKTQKIPWEAKLSTPKGFQTWNMCEVSIYAPRETRT